MRRFIAISMLTASIVAHAQVIPTIELEQITVEGRRMERRLADLPVHKTVISAYEFRRSGVVTLTDALKEYIPGFTFAPDAMGNNMRFRGLNMRYIAVYIDGVRLTPEGAGGNVNLDRIPLGQVDRITLVERIDQGVNLHIETREGKGAEASVTAGSHDMWRTEIGAQGQWRRLSIGGDVFRVSSGGFEGRFSAAPYTDWGGGVKARWTKKEGVSVAGGGRVFRHEVFNFKSSINSTHRLTESYMARLEANANGFCAGLTTDNYLDHSVSERGGGRKRLDNRTSKSVAAVRYRRILWDDVDMRGGVNFCHEEAFASTTLGTHPATRTLREGRLNADVRHVWSKWELQAGALGVHNSRFGGAILPSLAVRASVADGLDLRANVGTTFRSPSIKELYYDFDHQGMFQIYGNPDLKVEKGFHASLTGEYAHDRLNASVAIYRNRISDKIIQYQVAGADQVEVRYGNVGRATLLGIDATMKYACGERWLVGAAYSYCDARDDATGRQLDANALHSATGSVTWLGPVTVQAGVRAMSSYTYLNTAGHTSKTDPAAICRLALSREFGRLSLMFRVENIADERSPAEPAGRRILIGVKYKL